MIIPKERSLAYPAASRFAVAGFLSPVVTCNFAAAHRADHIKCIEVIDRQYGGYAQDDICLRRHDIRAGDDQAGNIMAAVHHEPDQIHRLH